MYIERNGSQFKLSEEEKQNRVENDYELFFFLRYYF